MNTQISISKIENGWLIAVPPSPQVIETAQRRGQQATGEITYAEDFEAAMVVLARHMK